jgi:hypothetical protein
MGNSVTLSGVTVDAYAYSGEAYSTAGSTAVSGNSLTISDSSVGLSVYGGGTYSATGTARIFGNTVAVRDSAVGEDLSGAYALSDFGAATSLSNTVTVRDSSVAGYVFGGEAQAIDTTNTPPASSYGPATASGNSVALSGSSVGGAVYGGRAESDFGSATASGNSLAISGGIINGAVYGGYALSANGAVEASGNTLIIGGKALLEGDLYGGYAASASEARAENNRLIITGAPDLSQSAIFGGFAAGSATARFSGNSLTLATEKTLLVKSISNVQDFAFILPAAAAGKDYVALAAQNSITFGDPDSRAQSRIREIAILGGASALAPGEGLSLFQIQSGLDLNIEDLENYDGSVRVPLSGRQGVSLLYDFSLGRDGFLEVAGVRSNPQLKALAEGFLAGLALLNQGADHIAGAGMRSAIRAARGAFGLAAFGAFAGGRSRYDSGSHIDVDGFSLLSGLAWGHDFTPGRLTLGAFFEYGYGKYDTHNSFSNAASVRGDGDTDYLGGGLLGRFDFAPTGPGNFHLEASGRAGQVDNDYDSSDLRGPNGRKAEYDSSSAYYGFHIGAGYLWNINEALSLDLYGKYFWTRQEGDSLRLSTDDPVRFKDADSSRLRGGARLTYTLNEYVRPYIGAAYEHEFDGQAEATTYGYRIKSPKLEGGTGIGELGFSLTPSTSMPLSFDLGVQGYTGTREGVTGSLQLRFEF